MIMKHKELNQWLWKWHFIAGLISLPFVILLAITGGVYLFKDNYNTPRQAHIKTIKPVGQPISYSAQWQLAKPKLHKPPFAMVVPTAANQATAFTSGMFSHKNSVYINPYTAPITGAISPKDSNMHTVRKLHGELLLGKFGTKIVELVASWMFVLIITGVYVFWPYKIQGWQGFFKIRLKQGKRTLYRDLHTVLGFWISILLLATLAGGMPWTDVFGANFKWLQGVTHTGFPKTWSARGLVSKKEGQPIPLDRMVALAKSMNLEGEVSIGIPASPKGVYSIYNTTFNLGAQKRYHFNQYTGKPIVKHQWDDVGVLMRGRMWFMAFHQGQSYLKRKKSGQWGVPKVPKSFKVGYGIIALLIGLSVIFPLFGISLVFISVIEFWRSKTAGKTS